MRIRLRNTEPSTEPPKPTLTVSEGVQAIAREAERKRMPAWGRRRRQLEDWPKRR